MSSCDLGLKNGIAPEALIESQAYTKSLETIMSSPAEILFVVEETADGGFVAAAVGVDIVTEANSLTELRQTLGRPSIATSMMTKDHSRCGSAL